MREVEGLVFREFESEKSSNNRNRNMVVHWA